MAVYLVAYDILNEGGTQDYEPLWHELKAMRAQSVQDGVWLLEDFGTEIEIERHLRTFLDGGDRLLVTRIRGGEFCQSGSRLGTEDWLAARLPAAAGDRAAEPRV